ncbi:MULTISPECIES: hypothetical protein [Arthrobacter]|uniref:DNA primase/nucleoside triphosphatase C-terminal domain-containing protein n=1 Tax=Arthrobacter terricola TaxID=2547396 RepID=A0A4R5KB88_9MICC|nr:MULTISPECIES: hypothetical protein [Arthrobacter]MBT8162650.1 hypothetical protein [Arthrobacter sp. GN70]TDF92429.1 hypothetical protein E1809_17975 [Arthrobacter terricola]
MTPEQINQFLQACVVRDDESDSGIDAGSLYGLYVSWCCLNRIVPVSEHAFHAALRHAGLRSETDGKTRTFPGLRMIGQAANGLHPQQLSLGGRWFLACVSLFEPLPVLIADG